ncbi:hypothetical protein HY636_05165 [Candidatus Woesearchaeota archaeon]|nr:hypothetical protein [Candidatus Woesearchaeota archaeon]
MPKHKFRKALIFITLLMIVTSLVIFQSPEYKKNYNNLNNGGSYDNFGGDGDLVGMGYKSGDKPQGEEMVWLLPNGKTKAVIVGIDKYLYQLDASGTWTQMPKVLTGIVKLSSSGAQQSTYLFDSLSKVHKVTPLKIGTTESSQYFKTVGVEEIVYDRVTGTSPSGQKLKVSNGYVLVDKSGKIAGTLLQTELSKGTKVVYLQQNPDGSFKTKQDGSFQTFNEEGEIVFPTATGTYFSQYDLDKIYDMIDQTLTGRGMPKSKEDIQKLLPSLSISVTGEGEIAVSGEGIGEPIALKGLSAHKEPTKSEALGKITLSDETPALNIQPVETPTDFPGWESTVTSPTQLQYTTATGKSVYMCNNVPCIKVGDTYINVPTNTQIPIIKTDTTGAIQFGFITNGQVVSSVGDTQQQTKAKSDFVQAQTHGVDVKFENTNGLFAATGTSKGLFSVTFIGSSQNDNVYKIGNNYVVPNEEGGFSKIKTAIFTVGSQLVVIKKGETTEYTFTGGTLKDSKQIVKSDKGYFTFDAKAQELKKLTSGTITYSDGIGIIKKGVETRLYSRQTEDDQTIYTQSSAATGFSQTETAYDQKGNPLKNAVVKIGSVHYAYNEKGAVQVVSNVGATDEYGKIVYWDSKNSRFINTDGSSADGMTVTYTDQHGQSQTITLLSYGLLPQQMTPPKSLAPAESAVVPKGVAEVSQTISNLNQLEGTQKTDNPAVVEALKQAGATVTSGNEKQAVEDFQKAWILQNCGDDGKGCTDTCIGKSVSGVCTADGKVGSKTIGALSAALSKKKESLYALPQQEEKPIVAGIALSGNIYFFTNTKGETVKIPTDVYQKLLQPMEKRDNNPDGKLTSQQIALLYDVISQQYPYQLDLNNLKCGADYCYVDKKNSWFTGDVIYKVEEEKGRQVVKVYNGADGSNFDKEKGQGFESLTYYNFEGNYLTQVSSVGKDGVTSIYNPSGIGQLETQDRVLQFEDQAFTYFHSDSAWHGEYTGTDTDAVTGKPITHVVKITGDGQIYLDEQLCSGSDLCQQIEDKYELLIEHIHDDPTMNTLVASAKQFGAQTVTESLPQPEKGDATVTTQEVKREVIATSDSGKVTIVYGGSETPAVIGNTAGLVFVKTDGKNTIWKVGEISDKTISQRAKEVEGGTIIVNSQNEVVGINKKDGNSLCADKSSCDTYMKGKFSLTSVLAGIAKLKELNALPQLDAPEPQVGPPAAVKAAEQKTEEVSSPQGKATITYGGGQAAIVTGTTVAMTLQTKESNGDTVWKLDTLPGKTVKNENLKQAIGGIVTIDKYGNIVGVETSNGKLLCSGEPNCQNLIGTSLDNLLEGIKKIPPNELTPKSAEVAPAPAPPGEERDVEEAPLPEPPTPKEEKPYVQPQNVAGLDANGYVASCITDAESCTKEQAKFAFKHESILDGVEGYVYVEVDMDGEIKKDEKTKEPTTCAAEHVTMGHCKAVNCDELKGCTQTSDGDKYCTKYQGEESCVKDPTTVTEKIIEECAKGVSADADKCAGANALSEQLYQSLDFEFRSRVEVVFGTLFDDWSNNAFSKLEYWMYDNVCHMNYYNAGESEVDLIAGGTITQEHNFAHNLSYLGQNEIIVTLGGEKEQVNGTIFRYAFSIQTIGPVHGVAYLYNKCTQKKSFSTTGAGWKDEFVVNNPLGVHRNHYATDQLTFDCDAEGIEECRFDHACLKILDNEGYKAPLCQKLEGDEIILNPETMDTDCGNVASTALEFKK